MPNQPTYPGVYLEEISSGLHTIAGVSTSITAFVGAAERGRLNDPVTVFSMAEFVSQFGPVSDAWPLSTAVNDYFRHGGSQAIIVRGGSKTMVAATTADLGNGLMLAAKSPGAWGNNLQVRVEKVSSATYNLLVHDSKSGVTEAYSSLPFPDGGRLASALAGSNLAVPKAAPSAVPAGNTALPADVVDPFVTDVSQGYYSAFSGAAPDPALTDDDIVKDGDPTVGIGTLAKVDIFNLLCIPPKSNDGADFNNAVFMKAARLCTDRRAILLADRHWDAVSDAGTGVQSFRTSLGQTKRNAALYFPRVLKDPTDSSKKPVSAVGAIAGIYARTDVQRGVWKAPAGTEAALGLDGPLSFRLNDGQNGMLNVQALNCLRTFPSAGTVVWGARMLSGNDDAADSDYKYVPVRRLTLFIEESLYRGTQWVVFEPNDEPLWAQIRLNVGAFMQTLFRQGAFQGRTAKEAFFVRCDYDTNPQADIDRGIVNILVGFAPLKPAEFVFIKIQQINQLAAAA